MNLLDVIKARRSIRLFTKDVPPKDLIKECLEAATWAPSATNQQPWEFIVLTGEELEKINAINQDKFAERMQGDPYGDIPEHLRERQMHIMSTLVEASNEAGIDPNEIFEKSLRFCDAPVAVYFVTYKTENNQYDISTAAALENFLIAAMSKGLGTCWLNVTIVCEEDIKKHLGITEDKTLLGSVAVGYPVEDSPINTFERERVPVDEVTTWLGY